MKRLLIQDPNHPDHPITWDAPDRIFEALRDLAAQPILDHAELVLRRGPEGSFELLKIS